MQSVNLIKRIVQTCLTLSTLSFGNDFEKRTYSIVKVTTTPVINGIIDDAFWGMAEVADYFTQYLPKSESLRSQSSDARLLFDDHDIYVAVRMYNDPVQISAQLLRCDALCVMHVVILINSELALRVIMINDPHFHFISFHGDQTGLCGFK